MKVLLIVLLILVTSPLTKAQGNLPIENELVLCLEKSRGDRFIEIKEGKRITIWLKEGDRIRGRFNLVDDSALLIDAKSCQITDIVKITVRRPGLQIISSILVVPLGAIAGTQWWLATSENAKWAFATATVSSVGVVGGFYYLVFHGRKFNVQDNWKLLVKQTP